MPAQQLTERSKDRIVAHMGLPANSSTAALMKKVDDGGLDVEFKGNGATSGHVTIRQWITVLVLVYVNLINYMDRLTLAGTNSTRKYSKLYIIRNVLKTFLVQPCNQTVLCFDYFTNRISRNISKPHWISGFRAVVELYI